MFLHAVPTLMCVLVVPTMLEATQLYCPKSSSWGILICRRHLRIQTNYYNTQNQNLHRTLVIFNFIFLCLYRWPHACICYFKELQHNKQYNNWRSTKNSVSFSFTVQNVSFVENSF